MIWTNESSFAIGGVRGCIWVIRRIREEYIESCLVPKFKKLANSVIIWRVFIGDILGPLVF